MHRFNERQGFLVSATVHLLVLMILARSPHGLKSDEEKKSEPSKDHVFLPPASVLKELKPAAAPAVRLAPAPPPRRILPEPTPPPVPPDAPKKSKISIGGPGEKTPMLLKKDEEVQAAKGRPDAGPSPIPEAPKMAEAVPPAGAPEIPGVTGLKMPPMLNGAGAAGGDDGSRARPGDMGPSIAKSLRNLDQQIRASGNRGISTGTGRQMGPLNFDPEGADFTAWINHFRIEVYRNWNIPEPALLGMRGHVDIEFVVERDGHLSAMRLLKTSGIPAFDRAAEGALQSSIFMALPSDFGPPRVTMQVSFYYNDGPRSS